MKKYLLFAILAIAMLSTTSCTKEVPENTIIDLVMKPTEGLSVVKVNNYQSPPFVVLFTVKVKNYGNTTAKVIGVELDISDKFYATSGFWYGPAGSGITNVNNANNYVIFDKETLSPGQETVEYNVFAQFRFPSAFFSYSYNNGVAPVEVKIKKIMTDKGNYTPQANASVSVNVVTQ